MPRSPRRSSQWFLAGLPLAAALPLLFIPPLFAQADQPAAFEIGRRLTIASKVLGEERTIFVRTPPEYERGRARFPVLYMTDGESQFLHTVGTAEFLARSGRIPALIIVAVTNTDRTRDLTPTHADMARPDGTVFKMPTSGGADKFLSFIETELIPFVEERYRTQPYRVFAGHSFGGLLAMHALVSKPELFNAFIAVSPTMTWDDRLPIKRAEAFLKGRTELKRTLFVTFGDEGPEFQSAFDAFREILLKHRPAGFKGSVDQLTAEDHGSVVLRSHYMGLETIFSGWRIPVDPDSGNVPWRPPRRKRALSKALRSSRVLHARPGGDRQSHRVSTPRREQAR